MLSYSDLIIKSRIFKLVSGDIDRGSLGHCYLVVSTDKVAVEEFFSLVACAVYCKDGVCLTCSECSRVLSGNNVDVTNVSPSSGKNYVVGDIEPITSDVYKKSYSGGKKLYFIHDADKMKADVQNKLLKILEEPPKDVHFFLSTTTEGAILDTVKSRSRLLYMDYFESRDISNLLARRYPEVDLRRVEMSANCCGGAIDKAEKLISDENFYERYNAVFDMFRNVKKSADVIKYSKSSLFDKENVSATLDMFEIVLRDVLEAAVGNSNFTMRDKKSEMERLGEEFSVAAISNIVDMVNLARKKIKANCAANVTGESLLYAVLEVKFKCQKL